jgi:hypothetical protein
MDVKLILILIALGEFIIIIMCLKGMNDFSKRVNLLNANNQGLADQVNLLQQQLKIASQTVTAETAYAGFKKANKESHEK